MKIKNNAFFQDLLALCSNNASTAQPFYKKLTCTDSGSSDEDE